MLHKLKLLGYPLKLFLTGKSEAVAFCPKSFFLIFIIVAEDFCVFFNSGKVKVCSRLLLIFCGSDF